MTTLDFVGTTPVVRPGIALVQLHDAPWQAQRKTAQARGNPAQLGKKTAQVREQHWRVTRLDGEVLGYIEQFRERQGFRYRAKRLQARQRRFVVNGEFWSIDDAIDCFG